MKAVMAFGELPMTTKSDDEFANIEVGIPRTGQYEAVSETFARCTK
jgi:hypothetical protein